MATLSFTCPKCQRQHDRVKPEMAGSKVRCQCGYVFRLGPKKSKPVAKPQSPAFAPPVRARPIAETPKSKPHAKPAKKRAEEKPVAKRKATESAESTRPGGSKSVKRDAAKRLSETSAARVRSSGTSPQSQGNKSKEPSDHAHSDSDSFANFEDSAALDELIEAEKEKVSECDDGLAFKPSSPASIPQIALSSEERRKAEAKSEKDDSVDDLLGDLAELTRSGVVGVDSDNDDDALAPLEDLEENDDVLEPIEDDEDEILTPIILTPQAAAPVAVYVPTPTPVMAPLVDPGIPVQGGGANPFPPLNSAPTASPYTSNPPYVPLPGATKRKVSGKSGPSPIVMVPGIFLAIVGGINVLWLLLVISGLAMAAGGHNSGINSLEIDPQQQGFVNAILAGGMVLRGVQILLSIALIIGGIGMVNCKMYPWAMAASIIALVPVCTPLDCLLIEPAVGLWALIVLCQSDVSRRF